jgi:hypothetical protein
MNVDSGIKRRGTVIRIPDSSPGLIVIDGAQKTFRLEGVWRAAMAPSVNQVVEVESDGGGDVVSVTAVDPRQLARERMDQLGGAAQEQGKQAAEMARKGIGVLAALMGRVTLGAAVVLWIAWFFLPAVKFSMLTVSSSFTAWDVLGTSLGQPGAAPSHGLFALLGLAAIAAPFVSPFLRHPRARLLNLAPLAYLVIAAVKVRWGISSAANAANQMGRAGMAMLGPEMQGYLEQATKAAVKSMMDALSLGFGIYVVIAAALVLAVQAFRSGPASQSVR